MSALLAWFLFLERDNSHCFRPWIRVRKVVNDFLCIMYGTSRHVMHSTSPILKSPITTMRRRPSISACYVASHHFSRSLLGNRDQKLTVRPGDKSDLSGIKWRKQRHSIARIEFRELSDFWSINILLWSDSKFIPCSDIFVSWCKDKELTLTES